MIEEQEQHKETVDGAEGASSREGAVAEDIAGLRAALDEEKGKAQQYLANWQRAQADFINYKRRHEAEREDAYKASSGLFILSLLPVMDDLERALTAVPPNLVGLTWVDGVRLIYRKLQVVLESQGVELIPAQGKDFDPRVHQAVLQAEGEEGKVLAELQRGYVLHGRVLRPAMVVVGQGQARPPEAPAEAPPDTAKESN